MEEYLVNIENYQVLNSLMKAKAVFAKHFNIVVAISGGSDSDIVLDICEKVKGNKNIKYVWYDTGIEYQATKKHLTYLENKYNIKIERIQPIKPIPICIHEFGVPFLSKQVSDYLSRLQSHNFQFEDEPYEILIKKYPKCISAIKWWCNECGEDSRFNINRYKYLKEFLIKNPPNFRIDFRCCDYSKKKPAKKFIEESNADMNVIGVRKIEGGIRSTTYKNCFTAKEDGADQYRPIFFLTNEDKKYYETKFNIVHSECYTRYGLKRTGCVGCPYAKELDYELKVIETFEPKLYKVCMNLFGKSYEYTKKYKKFCLDKKEENLELEQLTMDDLFYDYSATNDQEEENER